jgi:hypothetical protein
MQQSLSKMQRDISILKWYAFFITILLVAVSLYLLKNKNNRFKEITVERINIVEGNGHTRMVISNKELSPEVLAYGKAYAPPIPGHNRPGLIFYNDEGTENGGLTFMGHTDNNGKYIATGHLSFDQYNQNQVLYLQYADENGQQTTGLHVDEWQEDPPFWDFRKKYKAAQKLPEGPEKDQLLKQLMHPKPGQSAFAQRVFVGKDNKKTAMVILADRLGNPRIQLLVDSSGSPKLNFLDQKGRITYSLPK